MLNKKLHILFLSSWYPTKDKPFLGNFIRKHLELVAQKHQVTVLDLQSVKELDKQTISIKHQNQVTEIIVQYPKGSNPLSQWIHAKKAFKIGVQSIQQVDLIHGNVILSKGLQFIWAKNHFKKPLIVTEHASYFNKQNAKNWSFKEKVILNLVVKHAAIFTAVSPFLKDEIQQSFPKLKVEILPNVIDDSIFTLKTKKQNSKVKFVHISTLDDRYKNVSGIISACAELKKQKITDFELEIISDENYESVLKNVVAQSLENLIYFSGPLQTTEIAAKLQQSTALIMFSNYETFSCVVAESWSTGTPVIATSVGIANQLNANLGLQVSINDIASLVNAMKQFIQKSISFDAELIKTAAIDFSPKEVLKKIEEIYSAL